MAKKDKNISISSINTALRKAGIIRGAGSVRDFTHGMNPRRIIIPADVISWITTHDLSREGQKFHSRYVLKIPLSGINISCVDGHFFELHPGKALLIFPYQIHANSPLKDNVSPPEFLLVTFSIPQTGGQQLVAPLKNHLITLDTNWTDRLVGIIKAYQHPDPAAEARAVFDLAGLLSEMVESLPEKAAVEIKDERFAQICDYIKKNFQNDLNVNILAQRFSLSATTIRRLFRKNFNKDITPAHFIESIRIQHAIMSLLYTKENIAVIAGNCGYRDQFGFSRAFRRITGFSPRKYRLRYRE